MRKDSDIRLYPMILVAFFLAVGIVVGDFFAGALALWMPLVGLGVALFLYFILPSRNVFSSWMVCASIFFLGIFLYLFHESKLPKIAEDKPEEWAGVVVSRPQRHGKVWMTEMVVTEGRLRNHKVRVSVMADERSNTLREGNGLRCFSAFERIENYQPNSNFDYSRWARCNDLLGRTFLHSRAWTSESLTLSGLSHWMRIVVKSRILRRKIADKMQLSSTDSVAEAVVSAMVLGDKASLTREIRDVYSVSGGSHVLALSGLHLGIIYFVLSLLFLRRRGKFVGQLLIVMAIWAYAILTGLSISIFRAAIMITVYAFTDILGRKRIALNTLGVAATLILLLNPLSLWDVGFQMSFLAMLGITILYHPLYRLLPMMKWKGSGILKKIWGMCCISLSAQVGVAPLIAYYFGRFSCLFLLTNFVVVPCATVILYCALILLPMLLLGIKTSIITSIMCTFAQMQNQMLGWIASIPGASIEKIRINFLQLILIYIIIIAVVMLIRRFVKVFKTSNVLIPIDEED